MPTADFTTSTPNAGAGAAAALMAGQQMIDTAHISGEAGYQTGYNTSVYTNRTVPQLQSSIGASGQWYSGARQKAETNTYEDFVKGTHDVASAAQRQLDDLTRQRMYATVGLIV